MRDISLNKTRGEDWWDKFLDDDYEKDHLFNCAKSDSYDLPEVFKNFVSIVNLETSSYCNRKCSYCPLSIHEKPRTYMDYELFENILKQLSFINYNSTLSLNLYNEPLADEDIFDRIEMARRYLPDAFIKFNSNGDYMSPKILDRLVEVGNNALFITLHPGANKEYQDDDRLRHFKQFFKMTELEMEVSSIVKSRSITSDLMYKGMRLLVMSNNWGEYGNSRASSLPDLNSKTIRTAPCMRPFRELTIYHDGQVYPCCQFFPDSDVNNSHLVSDLKEGVDIFKAFFSKKMADYRRNLIGFNEKLSPCDTCRDVDYSKPESETQRLEILSSSIKGV